MEKKLSFEQWFDIFKHECESLKYYGPVDEDSAWNDFDNDLTPEEAARSFVNEMRS